MKFLILSVFCLLFNVSRGQAAFDTILTLYYDVNEFALTKAHIDSINWYVVGSTNMEYEITGFADSTGSPVSNELLAKRRAKKVFDYITKNKSYSICWFKIEGGSTAAGRDLAKNRRVTIAARPTEVFVKPPVVLKGAKGSSLYLEDSLGISIKEFFTPEELEENNLSTLTMEGNQLLSGGMFKFEFDTPRDSLVFEDMQVTYCMPIGAYQDGFTQANNVDYSQMTVWTSELGPDGKMRWIDTGIPFQVNTETNEVCVTDQGKRLGGESGFVNCDVPCRFEPCPALVLKTICILNPYEGTQWNKNYVSLDSTFGGDIQIFKNTALLNHEDSLYFTISMLPNDSISDFYLQINGQHDDQIFSHVYPFSAFELVDSNTFHKSIIKTEVDYVYKINLQPDCDTKSLKWWQKLVNWVLRKEKY